jgi:hypothetical protein
MWVLLFWVGAGLWVLFFYFESCERFLCHCTLLFWLSLQGDYEGPKLVLFFSLYMDEPHGKNTRDKFLFWFRFTRSLWRFPKRVLFFSLAWVDHMYRTRETNFCFGLVCKVVAKDPKKFYYPILFTYMCVSHVQKN